MIFRRRFAEVIAVQLGLFERDHADLVRRCEEALARYDAAGREEAEERYGEYLDLVEEGTELLAGLRDTYAATLAAGAAERYAAAFNRAVTRQLPRFALEIEDV